MIFAVFNGGPSPVTVSRGQDLFHIWFANLDDDAEDVDPKHLEEGGIGSDVVNGLGDQLVSMVSLEKRVQDIEVAQSKIMSGNQIKIALWIAFAAAAITVAVNMFMSSDDKPTVLLDQRSDLTIPSEPQISDDNTATESDSTAPESANDDPG